MKWRGLLILPPPRGPPSSAEPAQGRNSPASASNARLSPPDAFQRQCHGRGYSRPTVQQARQGSASQPKRVAVSVTFHPVSSMLSRISSPRCGGFSMGPTRSLLLSFMCVPLQSVIVHQIHVHDFAALESEHHHASCRKRARSTRRPDPRRRRGESHLVGEIGSAEDATPGQRGSRAGSSFSCSARNPLCLILMDYPRKCSATRFALQPEAGTTPPGVPRRLLLSSSQPGRRAVRCYVHTSLTSAS